MIPFNEPAFNRQVAEIVRFTVQSRIGYDIPIENFEMSRWQDEMVGDMVYRLSQAISQTEKTETKEDKETITRECPATWWDHFKMRFFPKWKRNMVSEEIVVKTVFTTKVVKICPHIKVPSDSSHFEFLTFGVDRKEGIKYS